MKIKILGSYYFAEEEIQKLIQLLNETKLLNKEHACRICSDRLQPGELKITNIVLGDKTGVVMPDRCKKGKFSIGVYHTHVSGTDNLSLSDMANHINSKHKIECVGGAGRISCYTRKKMRNFRKKIFDDIVDARHRCSTLWYDERSAKSIDRDVKKIHLRFSSELTEKYFDRISIYGEDFIKFHNLSEKWKEETLLTSSVDQIASNQSYLEIICMGKKVLPYIFQDLKSEPTFWFTALEAITGLNPIKGSHRGIIKLMTKDWLKWGEENGYI